MNCSSSLEQFSVRDGSKTWICSFQSLSKRPFLLSASSKSYQETNGFLFYLFSLFIPNKVTVRRQAECLCGMAQFK